MVNWFCPGSRLRGQECCLHRLLVAVLVLEDAIADTPDISAAGGSPSKAAGPVAADSTPAKSRKPLLQAQEGFCFTCSTFLEM